MTSEQQQVRDRSARPLGEADLLRLRQLWHLSEPAEEQYAGSPVSELEYCFNTSLSNCLFTLDFLQHNRKRLTEEETSSDFDKMKKQLAVCEEVARVLLASGRR